MGHRLIAAVSVSAALMLAAGIETQAQNQPRQGQLPPAGGQLPSPQRGPAAPQQRPPQQQAQQPGAAKPYKAVAIKLPSAVNDPSFEAFRKRLAEVAEKKDRNALAGMVSRSFFWMGDKGDKADKKRSGIDNLAKAIGLDGKDAADGWQTLAGYASDPTGAPYPERKDTICAPAMPEFNDDDFGALLKATNTEDGDWGYPVQAGVEMRATAKLDSPAVDKLGLHFVRVMEDQGGGNQDIPMVKVIAPSGKSGFVPADAISPLGNDELCYVKEGGAWKIAGFSGGE
jgi:hypothetical protein